MKVLALSILALVAGPALASCPTPEFTDPAQVRLNGNAVMLVTHASSTYDARASTKRGVDEAVRFAKQKRIPVVYLQDDSPGEFYLMDDCLPDYRVLSRDGEIGFDIQSSHVYVAGGHLELCLSHTLHDVLGAWARQSKRNLTVTYLMDAIYSNGKSIEESDRYYKDFLDFMSVVTYGRPGGEHWPKLTLLETMGIISREEPGYEYLKRILPHFGRTLPPDYQVEMQVNNSATWVLKRAKERNAPTLRFQFVDSALRLTENEIFKLTGG